MNQGTTKIAFNIGGALIGAVLACVSIFGLIAQQNSVSQPQTYKSTITYGQ
ncbi:hypothetical protein [Leekyejoonella antrihumi]|uniref:hypothetical protein n=1 Tax=Leekyejoonella antrihumi TaxID=1660198 RepID=UPI0016491653|nr:hypothetical protein [Leekyejoonella antrihumi]